LPEYSAHENPCQRRYLNFYIQLFTLPASGTKQHKECFAELLILMRGDRQLVTATFQTLHIKALERAVRLRLARRIFFFSLEPALRIYRHGATLAEWVGQQLSMLNWTK
jgi:hypothetical protein